MAGPNLETVQKNMCICKERENKCGKIQQVVNVDKGYEGIHCHFSLSLYLQLFCRFEKFSKYKIGKFKKNVISKLK